MTRSGEGLIYAVGFYDEVIFSVSVKLPAGNSVWLYGSFSMTRHKGSYEGLASLLAARDAIDNQRRPRDR